MRSTSESAKSPPHDILKDDRNGVGTRRSLAYYVAELHNNHCWALTIMVDICSIQEVLLRRGMLTANNWGILFKGGGMEGLASFIRLLIKDLIKFYRKPKMQITFSKDTGLRTWSFEDTGWLRKFATLNIINNGKDTAKRCVAVMTILKKPGDANNVKGRVGFPGRWSATCPRPFPPTCCVDAPPFLQ